jgi:hypothetical protein
VLPLGRRIATFEETIRGCKFTLRSDNTGLIGRARIPRQYLDFALLNNNKKPVVAAVLNR